MTYYRLALQDRQTARWNWKTTVLTSLQAVLQLLRSYSAYPQDSIRMFSAASKEDLNEMLRCENSNLASGSVTAAQFLQERKLQVPGKSLSEYRTREPVVQQATAVATDTDRREQSTTTGFPGLRNTNLLEKKRLEIECGPGGDHDTPYHFTLPVSMPQLLAWIHLQARIIAGEIQS